MHGRRNIPGEQPDKGDLVVESIDNDWLCVSRFQMDDEHHIHLLVDEVMGMSRMIVERMKPVDKSRMN